MYNTIIMPVDVFEMELSDKAIRHAEFLAQENGVIHLLHVLPGSASLSLHRFAADVVGVFHGTDQTAAVERDVELAR